MLTNVEQLKNLELRSKLVKIIVGTFIRRHVEFSTLTLK